MIDRKPEILIRASRSDLIAFANTLTACSSISVKSAFGIFAGSTQHAAFYYPACIQQTGKKSGFVSRPFKRGRKRFISQIPFVKLEKMEMYFDCFNITPQGESQVNYKELDMDKIIEKEENAGKILVKIM
jgi:hypothetical protein